MNKGRVQAAMFSAFRLRHGSFTVLLHTYEYVTFRVVAPLWLHDH